MIVSISDNNNLIDIIEISINIIELKKEFDNLFYPGPNPYVYNTSVQYEWLGKVKSRESKLVSLYGGDETGNGKIVYSAKTFINWLVAEKDAVRLEFIDFILTEFS